MQSGKKLKKTVSRFAALLLLFAMLCMGVSCSPASDVITDKITSGRGDITNVTTAPPGPKTEPEDSEMPVGIDFKSADEEQIGKIWSVKNEDNSKWKLEKNKGLVITSIRGELFQTDNDCKNIFLQDGKSNWIAETKMTLSETVNANYQQAGLIVYADDDNYVKLVCSFDGEPAVQFAYEKDAAFTSSAIVSVETREIWLRIRKEGNIYTAFYTIEGPDSGFQELGSCEVLLDDPKTGFTAFNGFTNAPSVDFTFEYVRYMDVGTPPTPEREFNMEMNKTELRMNPGKTVQLSAKAIGNGDAGKISYRSSDEKVVAVDENGLVTAVGEGYAVITANAENGNPAVCAVSVMPEKLYEFVSPGNPYLPIWEHIPDGEPYVFEDPDNPGRYRVYVYGSHDTKLTTYCGYEQVVWSAPVDDLTRWTYHGEIFKSTVQGVKDLLFAPDIAEVVAADRSKTYYFYPNNQTGGRRGMVAKSSRPDGPFVVCNFADSGMTKTEGPLGFDVTVLYDNGRVYGYWGFEYGDKCSWAELDPDNMSTLKKGTGVHTNLPTRTEIESGHYDPTKYNIVQDENVDKWGFFEAPSIRKIGNKYVLIFSRRGLRSEPTGCNTYQLAYGYSDSPEGPWKWGGIIVDAGGEAIPDGNGGYMRTFPADNTHGSVCEINGQWYIFYHRSNNRFSRQSMVDRITVDWNEASVKDGGSIRISTAEMTSDGFHINGLDPYVKYPASMVCFLTNGAYIRARYGRDKKIDPVVITGSETVAGIKYFDLGKNAPAGKTTKLAFSFLPLGKNVTVDVFLRPASAVNTAITRDKNGRIVSVGTGSILVGSFDIGADAERKLTTTELSLSKIDEFDGMWGLFFVFHSEDEGELCELYTMELFTDKPSSETPDTIGGEYVFNDFTGMTGEELKNNWDIVREDAELWKLVKGNGLVLKNARPGLYGHGGDCKNIFLTDVTTGGDYTVETKINLSQPLTADWQQFVLLVYLDDDNYIKMNYGMNSDTGCQFLFEKDGSEQKSFGTSASAQTVWLRISKSGNMYTGYYSTDGSNFIQVGKEIIASLDGARLGFAAHNDGGEAPVIDFTVEYLNVYPA